MFGKFIAIVCVYDTVCVGVDVYTIGSDSDGNRLLMNDSLLKHWL